VTAWFDPSNQLMRVRDDKATLTIAAGSAERCQLEDEHNARCTLPPPSSPIAVDQRFGITLGDRDDRATLLTGGRVLAGDGKDILLGGDGDDVLEGERGSDVIFSGGGDDTLVGGDQTDQFDGGAGRDHLWYRGEAVAVEIDLLNDTSEGAARDEGIKGIEDLTGGTGPDVLSGDEGPNRIDGGEGRSTILGRGGDDVLSGGPDTDGIDGGEGSDRLDGRGGNDDQLAGGPANDLLLKGSGTGILRGGEGDDRLELFGADRGLRLLCGAGRDVAASAGLASIGGDCERLAVRGGDDEIQLTLPLRLKGRTVTTRGVRARGKTGRLVIRDPRTKRVLGSVRFRGRGYGTPVTLRIRLTAAAALRGRRAGRLPVIVQRAGSDRRVRVTIVVSPKGEPRNR
jgi:Ca2+-binding RTX toxin-like protein